MLSTVARDRRDTQLNEIDGLDSKAAQLLAFGAVLLGLLFTADLATDHWNWVSTAGASLFMAATTVLGYALWPRGYRFDPNVATLNRIAMNWDPASAHHLIALSAARAISHNQELLRRKAHVVRLGVVLLAAAVLVSGVRLICVSTNQPTESSDEQHWQWSPPSDRPGRW